MKYAYYVAVIVNSHIYYVTDVDNVSKTVQWTDGRLAKALPQTVADSIADGLNANNIQAVVYKVPASITVSNAAEKRIASFENYDILFLDDVTGVLGEWFDMDMSEIPQNVRTKLSEAYNAATGALSNESKLEIASMLTISTAHIAENTANFLDNQKTSLSLVVYPKDEFGWFILTDDLDPSENIPEDLLKCINYAKRKGCSWLCIDRDGDVINDLPTFNW